MLKFVTGKGGVGKSSIALRLALKDPHAYLSETSTSLLSLAERSHLAAPTVLRFTREDLARDFLRETLHLEIIVNMLLKSPLFSTLLSLAPNLNDILLLEKWIELSKEQPLIVDAPATGHFLALLESVRTAQDLFDGGSLKRKAERIESFLNTPLNAEVFIVSIPEHSSLEESKQIERELKSLYPALSIHHILNRVHEAPMGWSSTHPELQALAFERPAREQKRIAGWSFSEQILEGEVFK